MTTLVRGRIYAAKLPHVDAEKYYLVVSNNRRNRNLPQVLAVRLTTSRKAPQPSIVELGPGEVLPGGRIVCDDIETIWENEVTRDMGALSQGTMARVEAGLRAALGVSPR